MSGRLQSDPLFQGLARPAMIAGVSYDYFVVNGLFSLLTFIWTKDFLIILLLAPMVHLIGFLLCMREPRTITLTLLRLRWGFRSWNRLFHGNTNSYDVY
jgi:type IV secretion system protein VirB3